MLRVEPQAEKAEIFGVNLIEAGKRGGQFTPVSSIWKPIDYDSVNTHGGIPGDKVAVGDSKGGTFMVSLVSARKLAAAVWELNHYKRPLRRMTHADHLPRRRKIDLHPCSPSKLVENSDSSKRHSFGIPQRTGHHQSRGSTHHVQVAVPYNHRRSIEIPPYNPAMSPLSSAESERTDRETTHTLRTSAERLTVVNRIWRLEEQQSSNAVVVRGLKKELDVARSKIKSLLREQHADHQELDELVKHIRTTKFQEAMRKPAQSIKIRNRIEDFNRKLAREVDGVRSALMGVSEELENERRSRGLLEELCDAFAIGIKDYEKKMHFLRQRSDKNWRGRSDLDQLLLHVAESWLDERIQIKLSITHDGKSSAVEKLRHEIQALVSSHDPTFRRQLPETAPLIAADERNDADPLHSDSNLLELEKTRDDMMNSKTIRSNETTDQKGLKKAGIFPALQMNSESLQQDENLHSDEHLQDHKKGKQETCSTTDCVNSNYAFDNSFKTRHSLRELRNWKPPSDVYPASTSFTRRNVPSPVRRWTGKLPSNENDTLKPSSRLPPDLKENSLEAKLFEARRRTKGSKSRRKTFVIASEG